MMTTMKKLLERLQIVNSTILINHWKNIHENNNYSHKIVKFLYQNSQYVWKLLTCSVDHCQQVTRLLHISYPEILCYFETDV